MSCYLSGFNYSGLCCAFKREEKDQPEVRQKLAVVPPKIFPRWRHQNWPENLTKPLKNCFFWLAMVSVKILKLITWKGSFRNYFILFLTLEEMVNLPKKSTQNIKWPKCCGWHFLQVDVLEVGHFCWYLQDVRRVRGECLSAEPGIRRELRRNEWFRRKDRQRRLPGRAKRRSHPRKRQKCRNSLELYRS